MKKIFATAVAASALCAGVAFGQSMKVHTKTEVKSFSLADVDSVTFLLDNGTAPLTNLKMADNEVAGWVGGADGCFEFNNVEQLQNRINGAADKYLEYGMVEGFMQELHQATATDVEVGFTVMDCGTAENATALYNFMKQDFSLKAAAGSYDEATAIINIDYLTSVRALVHFGKYYAEITPGGFGKALEITTATSFIDRLKAKVDAQK